MMNNHRKLPEVILRAPEPEDISMIYLWENESDEAHSSLRTGPISRHSIARYIEEYDGEIYTLGSLRYMIDDINGETIGTIDVFDFDHRARHAFTGIYISRNRRRKGYALAALKRVEQLMARNVGMHSLAALVAVDNAPSRALFEAAGYRSAGRLNSWLTDGARRIDALVYQRML